VGVRIGTPTMALSIPRTSTCIARAITTDGLIRFRKAVFPNLGDPHRILDDFLQFCNVVKPPFFKRGLFA